MRSNNPLAAHVLGSNDESAGEPAKQSTRGNHDVGMNIRDRRKRKGSTGRPEDDLRLVDDQQHSSLVAKLAKSRQVVLVARACRVSSFESATTARMPFARRRPSRSHPGHRGAHVRSRPSSDRIPRATQAYRWPFGTFRFVRDRFPTRRWCERTSRGGIVAPGRSPSRRPCRQPGRGRSNRRRSRANHPSRSSACCRASSPRGIVDKRRGVAQVAFGDRLDGFDDRLEAEPKNTGTSRHGIDEFQPVLVGAPHSSRRAAHGGTAELWSSPCGDSNPSVSLIRSVSQGGKEHRRNGFAKGSAPNLTTNFPPQSLTDFRADAAGRKDFEQQRVTKTAIDDVDLPDATTERFETGFDFGNHARIDDALVDQLFGLVRRQRVDDRVGSSLSRRTPLTSERNTSFSAPSDWATAIAAVSALTL